MASNIIITSIIFIFIWILSVIIIDRISQKRANTPFLKKTYRL